MWVQAQVVERLAMSELGQNAKYSERADDFRLAPMNGHHQASILVTSGARLATVFEQRQPDLLEDSMRPVKAHGVGLLVWFESGSGGGHKKVEPAPRLRRHEGEELLIVLRFYPAKQRGHR